MELFYLSLMRMRKTLKAKTSTRKVLRKVDTRNVKKLRSFQYCAEKNLVINKNTCILASRARN